MIYEEERKGIGAYGDVVMIEKMKWTYRLCWRWQVWAAMGSWVNWCTVSCCALDVYLRCARSPTCLDPSKCSLVFASVPNHYSILLVYILPSSPFLPIHLFFMHGNHFLSFSSFLTFSPLKEHFTFGIFIKLRSHFPYLLKILSLPNLCFESAIYYANAFFLIFINSFLSKGLLTFQFNFFLFFLSLLIDFLLSKLSPHLALNKFCKQ